jgi:hypothetical protein
MPAKAYRAIIVPKLRFKKELAVLLRDAMHSSSK